LIEVDNPLSLPEVYVPRKELYAYETYWLYTLAGIRDEGRIINAPDTANYSFENFKIKNVTSPSVPVVLID
jgi:hypothetical protein